MTWFRRIFVTLRIVILVLVVLVFLGPRLLRLIHGNTATFGPASFKLGTNWIMLRGSAVRVGSGGSHDENFLFVLPPAAGEACRTRDNALDHLAALRDGLMTEHGTAIPFQSTEVRIANVSEPCFAAATGDGGTERVCVAPGNQSFVVMRTADESRLGEVLAMLASFKDTSACARQANAK